MVAAKIETRQRMLALSRVFGLYDKLSMSQDANLFFSSLSYHNETLTDELRAVNEFDTATMPAEADLRVRFRRNEII